MTDDFGDFLRRTEEATQRSVADVIAADEATAMTDEDFDDAVWLALCGRVHSMGDLEPLAAGVRMYFATRTVEWEVGNGGFAQAVDNVAEYWGEAIAGYRLLGDEASAVLLVQVQRAAGNDDALEAFDDEVEGPPWNGVPWGDESRVRYVRDHRDDFRLP